jgi:hypothetical protein
MLQPGTSRSSGASRRNPASIMLQRSRITSGRPVAKALEPAQARVVLVEPAHCARRVNGPASSGRHRPGHRKIAHEPRVPALGFYVPVPPCHSTAVQASTFRRHGERPAPGVPSAGMPRSSSEHRRVHEKRCRTASTALAQQPCIDVTATRNTRARPCPSRTFSDTPKPCRRCMICRIRRRHHSARTRAQRPPHFPAIGVS